MLGENVDEEGPIRSYKDLDVWQLSMQLAKGIYRLSDHFPRKEEFRMTSQLVRAAISIPANIAEGNARKSRKDYAHFISIARGSAAELDRLLLLVKEIGLAPSDAFTEPAAQVNRVGQMLNVLHRKLSS